MKIRVAYAEVDEVKAVLRALINDHCWFEAEALSDGLWGVTVKDEHVPRTHIECFALDPVQVFYKEFN